MGSDVCRIGHAARQAILLGHDQGTIPAGGEVAEAGHQAAARDGLGSASAFVSVGLRQNPPLTGTGFADLLLLHPPRPTLFVVHWC